MSSETSQRLEALEVKAAFTEDLLDQLNLTIYRQQLQITQLQRELQALRERRPEGTPRSLRDELPPHY